MMIPDEILILVNENDEEMGQMEKIQTHQLGLLHRAFSIFIFNSKGALLLQKRALGKYHSPGLWSNTCCSHPVVGEPIADAAKRRLMQEMGMKVELRPIYSFIYNANFENGLIEHEYDHVFIGVSDDSPKPNATEVCDVRFISPDDLKIEMELYPEQFSIWLRICFDAVNEKIATSRYFQPL